MRADKGSRVMRFEVFFARIGASQLSWVLESAKWPARGGSPIALFRKGKVKE
jgi:hypothetical protein